MGPVAFPDAPSEHDPSGFWFATASRGTVFLPPIEASPSLASGGRRDAVQCEHAHVPDRLCGCEYP